MKPLESTIEVENLSFAYDSGKKIFSNVSMTVKRGEVFTILGHNGCGKSTLLNCIANQLVPLSGTVKINGKPVSRMRADEFAGKAAYVAQFHQPLFAYTVEEFVLMGRTSRLNMLGRLKKEDHDIAWEMMSLMKIEHLAEKSYLEISGGERQMVLFAQALTLQPDFIILDEPTSHLDFGNQIRCLEIIEKLAGEGYGILLTSHFPDHVLMFRHKTAIMHNGGLLECGSAEEVITKENIERIYNLPVKIKYDMELGRETCLPE